MTKMIRLTVEVSEPLFERLCDRAYRRQVSVTEEMILVLEFQLLGKPITLKNVKLGRRPCLTREQNRYVHALAAAGLTHREIAEKLNVSISTIYRCMKR